MIVNDEVAGWKLLLKRMLKNGTRYGLCHATMFLKDECRIDDRTYHKMRNRISDHMALMNTRKDGRTRVNASSYLARKGWTEPRVIAAQLLLLEAQEDEAAAIIAAFLCGVDAADEYEPRANAVPEAASTEEWAAGAGGVGFDDGTVPDRSPW